MTQFPPVLCPWKKLNLITIFFSQYFVTAESRFPTLAELVHHHSIHSDGLITQVTSSDILISWKRFYFDNISVTLSCAKEGQAHSICIESWNRRMGNGQVRSLTLEIWILSHISRLLQSTPFHPAIRPRSSWLGKRNGLMVGVKSSIFSSFYPFVLCMHGGEMFPLSRPLTQLDPLCRRGERCTGQRLSGIIYCYWLHPDDLYLAGRTSWWSTSWAGASMATCTRPSGRGTTSPSPSRLSG